MLRKTVLHIAPTPFFSDRGCHIRIEGIVQCLNNEGYENLVCTYHHGRDIKSVSSSRISPIRNYTQTEAGPSKYKVWADIKLLCLVVKEIKRVKPSILHAHLHEGLMIGLIAKTLFFWKKLPIVADMQGSLVGELESHGFFNKLRWLKSLFRWLEASLMFFAKTIICSSCHSLNKIKTEFNIRASKINLVQDGAKLPNKLSDQQRESLLSSLNIADHKVLLVYSGALLENKGLNEIKQLIASTQDQTNVHFLIIGYPIDTLKQYLSNNNLVNKCTLTGQLPFQKLPEYLQLADIAIEPKLNDAGEGSGKILNYIACGLPVLAFDTLNNREFLPSESPLAKDQESMNSLLKTLADKPDKRDQLGVANFKHFQTHFSWQQTQAQLSAVYKNLP